MQLSDIAEAYTVDGPVVTAYVDTESDVPDAAQRLETRWKNTVRDLEERGVDGDTIAALESGLGEHNQGGTRVLVGARGQLVLATSLPTPSPRQERITVDALPDLLPVVEHLTLRVPHLVVLVDRTGADVFGYTESGSGDDEAVADHTWTVDGAAYPIHKVPSGGWSQRRYQAGVEEGWEANAKQVASTIADAAHDIGAQVVVATGDERMLGLVRENLPQDLTPRWREVPGGRAQDGSAAHLGERVLATLGEYLAYRDDETLASYAEHRGRSDRATDGAAETVAALRRAQVGTLLLTEGLDSGQRAYFGSDPAVLALEVEEITDLGESSPREGALVDVLLRAALHTAAEVRVLPAGDERSPAGGVGALLRY